MKGWIGKILVTILGLALLVYSATRSVEFISMTLPEDKQILAWFGLAALDGGIIVWLLAFMFGSHGGAQRGISILMVLIDFVGAVAMFTADTVVNTGKTGLTVAFDQATMMTFIILLSVIIALNIGAGLAHHITDPEHMRRMADEEAHGRIEDQARASVSKQSEALAAELAPVIADAWMANTRAKYMHAINETHGKIPSVAQQPSGLFRGGASLPRAEEPTPPARARTIYAQPLRLRRNNRPANVNYNAEADPTPLPLEEEDSEK